MDQTDLGRISQAMASVNKLHDEGIGLTYGRLDLLLDGESTGLVLDWNQPTMQYEVAVA